MGSRYCFYTSRKDGFEFIKNHYTRVDVDVTINDPPNSNEICVELKDSRDNDIFVNLNERLSDVQGFTTPVYVPNWKNIEQNGPYFPSENYDYLSIDLIDRKNKKRYRLSPSEENIARLYATRLVNKGVIDEVFQQHFWNDFKDYLRATSPFKNFAQIDWSDAIAKISGDSPKLVGPLRKEKYGYVLIDGERHSVTPFSVPPASLITSMRDPLRGAVRSEVAPQDVTLNLSPEFTPPRKDFGEIVYVPGAQWSAKWKDSNGEMKYMEIEFDEPDFSSSSSSSSSEIIEDDEDIEGKEIDYIDDSEDEDEDINTRVVAAVSEKPSKGRRQPLPIPIMRAIELEELPDFEDLDTEELNLPIASITSKRDQWDIVLKACHSGFTEVFNLSKVSNLVLKLVADASMLAINKNLSNSITTNTAFINYASKRLV